MKTIRCNLTKACQIFAFFTESLCKNMGIYSLQNFKKFHLFFEELYARLYHWYMFEAMSVLVYTRDPYSKGYNSISILYFSLGLVPV